MTEILTRRPYTPVCGRTPRMDHCRTVKLREAVIAAPGPEPHRRFTVVAGTLTGAPASGAACR
ncbi:hypothetical protein [Streptomyces shenzhenensis]|uniref:hypothetical protein n=1 Tax=Streptomyces TaxID=1883 RepID=UPI001F1853FF|nr:hypothetical protein [Streptomyces shenzhenensis]